MGIKAIEKSGHFYRVLFDDNRIIQVHEVSAGPIIQQFENAMSTRAEMQNLEAIMQQQAAQAAQHGLSSSLSSPGPHSWYWQPSPLSSLFRDDSLHRETEEKEKKEETKEIYDIINDTVAMKKKAKKG